MKDDGPFGSVISFKSSEKLLLVPSNWATILRSASGTWILGPHDHLCIVNSVEWVISVRPEIIKLIFGKASRFVNRSFSESQLWLLSLFSDIKDAEELRSLLIDARQSVSITHDEEDFVVWWQSGFTVETSEKYLERICKRYAGESPRDIQRQAKIGTAIISYLRDSTSFYDKFSDESHFIRSIRKSTGLTPKGMKNLSGTFYYAGTEFSRISPEST